jgi:hypothetical protein
MVELQTFWYWSFHSLVNCSMCVARISLFNIAQHSIPIGVDVSSPNPTTRIRFGADLRLHTCWQTECHNFPRAKLKIRPCIVSWASKRRYTSLSTGVAASCTMVVAFVCPGLSIRLLDCKYVSARSVGAYQTIVLAAVSVRPCDIVPGSATMTRGCSLSIKLLKISFRCLAGTSPLITSTE